MTVTLLTAGLSTVSSAGNAATQLPASVGQPTPAEEEEMSTFLTATYDHVDAYWHEQFKSLQAEGPSAFIAIPVTGEDPYRSKCVEEPIAHDTESIFYCPDDDWTNNEGVDYTGGIYFPVTMALALQDQHGPLAPAVVLAHEYGHEVQNELMEQKGWEDIVQIKDGAPVLENGQVVPVKEKELIADCFSGNWTKYASQQDLIPSVRLPDAISALESAGDVVIGQAQPHGSKYERTTAFTLGYNSGDPVQCIHQYWVTEQWE
ncbi:neutral zinc metallopeptidase [Streptomyces sp. NPDC051954]|uniref:neutral zinc metallopeptidase n=1 Tax=unclassified Streptomyces TaxID=2593676 RepID=UPI003425616D